MTAPCESRARGDRITTDSADSRKFRTGSKALTGIDEIASDVTSAIIARLIGSEVSKNEAAK
jgi:hypothetical protein